MPLLQLPTVNVAVRTLARPFAPLLPVGLRFPVTGRIRVRPDGGAPFWLACNPTSYLAKVVFWGGPRAFEPELVDVVRELAGSSRLFLDVGANLGYYSLLATAYNPALQVVAFEPVPDIFGYLEQNRDLNGRSTLTTERIALGASAGPVTFHAPRNPKYPGLPQLGGSGSVDEQQAAMHGQSDRIVAAGDTLDAYAARALTASRPVDLVKVDVEGAEPEVLRGGAALIAQDRPVVLFESLARAVDDPSFGVFHDLGFEVYAATIGHLVRVMPGAPRPAAVTNFVAVPPEARGRLGRCLGRGAAS